MLYVYRSFYNKYLIFYIEKEFIIVLTIRLLIVCWNVNKFKEFHYENHDAIWAIVAVCPNK